MRIDARIPVWFVDFQPRHGRADQVLLLAENMPDSPSGWLAVVRLPGEELGSARLGHEAGCSCCSPRSARATTMIRLFQARARGEIGFFRGIVANLPSAEAASLRAVLRSDPFLSGSFVSVDEHANRPNSEP